MLLRSAIPVVLMLANAGVAAQEMHSEEPAMPSFVPFGEVRLRYEETRDIPGRVDDIHRGRGRARIGMRYHGLEAWEFGGAFELALGSDDNADNRRNKDNERSDHANIDQLYARYRFSEASELLLGKAELPLQLSPLLWDEDHRPIGASVNVQVASGDFNAWSLAAGYFAPDHLYDDHSRLAAVQLGYHFQQGAPNGASALLSYLAFSDLDRLVQQGLGRTNRRTPRQFISNYRLLDLQLSARTEVGGWPFVGRIDLVRNTAADDLNHGGRASLVLGDAHDGGFEFGFAYQRAERDAVLSAFADDDWWFQSFARGGMPWVGYGFNEHLRIRMAGFHERRDAFSRYTDRYLVDLTAQW